MSLGGLDMPVSKAEASSGLRGGSHRALLQGTQPPGGGFRAAKYFTYVFFALGVVVVGFFVSVCVLHCHRRRIRRRAHQQQQAARQQPYSLPAPLMEIHLSEAGRSRAAAAPVPLKEFNGVLILHPDGTYDVGYAPDQPLPPRPEPELTLDQAAARVRRRLRAAEREARFRRAMSEIRDTSGSGRRRMPRYIPRDRSSLTAESLALQQAAHERAIARHERRLARLQATAL